jgi:hypothetical protein
MDGSGFGLDEAYCISWRFYYEKKRSFARGEWIGMGWEGEEELI